MNALGWFAFGLFYILFPLAVLAYALRDALRGRGSPHRVQRQMLDALRPLSPGADPGQVRQLQQALIELSQRATQAREPVRGWGATLHATGQALDKLLVLGSYQELLDNSSLQMGSYFNGRLNRHIHQVRAALQERDPGAITRSLGYLQSQVEVS